MEEKDLGVLKGTRLNISQQWALAAKKACTALEKAFAKRLREVIFPSALVRPHLECFYSYGLPSVRDIDMVE